MNSTLPKYLKRACKESSKAGWTWEQKTNHITVRNPKGDFVVCVSKTAYEGTLAKKHLSQLRKAGCPGA